MTDLNEGITENYFKGLQVMGEKKCVRNGHTNSEATERWGNQEQQKMTSVVKF